MKNSDAESLACMMEFAGYTQEAIDEVYDNRGDQGIEELSHYEVVEEEWATSYLISKGYTMGQVIDILEHFHNA